MSLEQYKDASRKELWDILQIQMQVLQAETAKVAELEKDISIAAKIMIDITNAQTVTDEGHSVGYLVTNKMMDGLDVFIGKALKEQGK